MEAVVMLIVFGATTFVLYLFLSARHKERMAIIENDKDINILKPRIRLQAPWALKIGLLLFCAGSGILIGYFTAQTLEIPEDVTIPSFLFMFAGIGLLAYYAIAKKISKETSDQL